MAFVDSTSRILGVCEFGDNDQYSNVEVWLHFKLHLIQNFLQYEFVVSFGPTFSQRMYFGCQGYQFRS